MINVHDFTFLNVNKMLTFVNYGEVEKCVF